MASSLKLEPRQMQLQTHFPQAYLETSYVFTRSRKFCSMPFTVSVISERSRPSITQ